MNRTTGLSCTIAALVIWTGSLSYGQSMQTGTGLGPTTGGGGGGAGAGPGAGTGAGAATSGRASGVTSGFRLGTTSETPTQLGSTNRIDRTAAGQNPRGQRGSFNPLSISGDGAQGQGLAGANRQLGQTGLSGFNQGLSGFNQGLSGLNQNQNRRQQNQRRAQYSTRVAFTAPTRAEAEEVPGVPGMPGGRAPSRLASLQESLESLADSSVHVSVEGDTVVLRGTVAGESDRRVAERMAKLEPGVSRVRNELAVASASTAR